MTTENLFLLLLRNALWGGGLDTSLKQLSHQQYKKLMALGQEQAVMGLLAQALIDNDARLEQEDVFDAIGLTQSIAQQNRGLNQATAKICRMMDEQDIRILVVKGQTLALLYRLSKMRQCGDVDFLCHPEDIEKAVFFLRNGLGLKLNDAGSNKHAGFEMDGVKFEIHRTLTNFAYPAHQRYWENVIMKEAWSNPSFVTINGVHIPTLPSTYNAIYVFVHIMFHLIVDGVGIRQFCDWAMVLDKEDENIDRELLKKHLKGIGLLKAYSGLGAVLTDFLALSKEKFPFEISSSDHKRAKRLVENIIKMGNFGHNIAYQSKRGPKHAIEHLVRMWKQCWRFYKYAPKEVLWRIPYFIGWWAKRMFRAVTPYRESSKTIFQKQIIQ